MAVSQGVIELVASAQANARASQERISDIMSREGGVDDVEALRAATVELELTAVDIFSIFEVRMQHHFKRGPFSRKLVTLLVDSGQADLADRIHQYYLAINVLKHGKGESYRELMREPNSLIVVRPAQDTIRDDAHRPVGLVDVTDPSFFAGLTEAIVEAYRFLEKR
ncbi:hypothetical protein P775_04890 [Puniceibacterium antarcticum]|uniref:Uncharacterized protein n=1 Tax=Puniceibacterium antarcticum TaxID=1206336 RepID=A0A2G8RJR4_9RHOB|nr:hypothetical protein [Puniceibacterium antarcticum]PIL21328.1 hypothetical protein P775_04890 [Puniceibacterium antarcticum]